MINVRDLTPGTRVEVGDGTRLVVTQNMDDGQWVTASEDGAPGGELVHAQDIVRVLEE